jgi:myo-inositol catabolism protein IolS
MGILCYSPLAQGLLTGKFASAAEVPDGRARTRLFSGTRALARHGQAGQEEEAFAAIARIGQVSAGVGQPMAQVALAWLLHQPGVSSVIAGARRPEQIRETARAAELELPPEVVQALTAATESLRQSLGPDPDMWQAESRFR